MKKAVASFLCVFTCASLADAQSDAKATAVMEQARAALGGRKLASASGLSIAGTYRRTMGEREVTGELSMDFQMPDRFLRTESMSLMGDAVVTRESGMNGDQLLQSSKTTGGGPGMMIRMASPEGPNAEATMLRSVRSDFARHALAFLLTAPNAASLQFTYGGEATGDEGKADVVDVKGADGFEPRLFFDKESHRPLLLSYKGAAPRIIMRTQTGPVPAAPSGGADASHAGEGMPTPEVAEIQMFFSEYKPVDGVLLPHKITRSINGQPNEEWDITKIKVNPAFKAETFQKR